MVFMARTQSEDKYSPPVKEGQLHNAAVVGFGKTGDPIVKVEKYTIFLKDCIPTPNVGDVLPIKIEKTLPRFGFATVIPDE